MRQGSYEHIVGPTRMQILSAEYEKILEQSNALLAEEKDLIANAANLSALVFEALEAVDWVGIYFLRNGELVLGPFQGRAVKPRVALGRSAAGRVVRDLRSAITDGRTADEGNADDLSQAQVIVPILLHDRCVGVFEIDSPFAGRFDDHDRAGMEALANLLIEVSDTSPLLPRRASISELRPGSNTTQAESATPTATVARERLERDPEIVHERKVQPRTAQVLKRPVLKFDALESLGGLLRSRSVAICVVALCMLIVALRVPFNIMPSAFVTTRDMLGHAFATLIGYVLFGTVVASTWRMRIAKVALATAVFAFIIAIIQSIAGVQTKIPAHFVDVVCGYLGGYLGGLSGRALRRRLPLHQKA